jgi:hypothetical protein
MTVNEELQAGITPQTRKNIGCVPVGESGFAGFLPPITLRPHLSQGNYQAKNVLPDACLAGEAMGRSRCGISRNGLSESQGFAGVR